MCATTSHRLANLLLQLYYFCRAKALINYWTTLSGYINPFPSFGVQTWENSGVKLERFLKQRRGKSVELKKIRQLITCEGDIWPSQAAFVPMCSCLYDSMIWSYDSGLECLVIARPFMKIWKMGMKSCRCSLF